MINPNQLRAFLAVVDTGSMNQAARRLHCSQSTISRQVEQLEDETGLQLFHRDFSSRRLALTEQGELILAHCRQTLANLEDLHQLSIGLSQGIQPEFTLAIPGLFAEDIVARLAKALREEFATTKLRLLHPSPHQVEEILRTGSADLALSLFDFSMLEGFNVLGLGPIEGQFISHSDHPLAQMKNISLVQLEQHCQISFIQSASFRPELNFSHQVIEVQTLHQALALVEHNLGFLVAPTRVMPTPPLVRLSTQLDARLVYSTQAVYPKASESSPITRWLLNYLSRHGIV